MTQHTLGPWYANTKGSQGIVYSETDGKNIAVSYDVKDAPLVAAAPDLLVALEALQQGFIDGDIEFTKRRRSDSDPYHPANVLMAAAIAKAKGE